MSRRNGDRARADRQHKAKLLMRARIRAILKETTTTEPRAGTKTGTS